MIKQLTALIMLTPLQINTQVILNLLSGLAILGVILLVTWAISRIMGSFVLKTVSKLSPNVARQAKRFTTWLIWLVGIMVGLDQLGLDLTILLMIVTLGAITVIIAIRNILADIAAHEAIATYAPYKIGDWVQIDDFFGRVVDINLVDTIIITPDNETVYIPNSRVTKTIVVNRTTPVGIRISVPITVNKTVNLSKAEEILLKIGSEVSDELTQDSKPEVRMTDIDNHSVSLELLLKISNPARSRFITSEVLKKAAKKLDKAED